MPSQFKKKRIYLAATTHAKLESASTCNIFNLKIQSCKLCDIKYMIASTQVTNTEISSFIAVLVFKLFSRKVLFINRKDNRNC